MNSSLLLRMRSLATLAMVVVAMLPWQPVTSAQKPFSPYDSGSYNGKMSRLMQNLGYDKTSTRIVSWQHPRCLPQGSGCNAWGRSAPCCGGTTCRNYSDANCMVAIGREECWCKPPSKVFGFINWYRK